MSRFAFCPCRMPNRKRMEVKDGFALRSLPCFCVGGTDHIKHQAKWRKPFHFPDMFQQTFRFVSVFRGADRLFLSAAAFVYPLIASEAEAAANSESHTSPRVKHALRFGSTLTPFCFRHDSHFSRGHSFCDVETLLSCRAAGSLRRPANL